MYVLDWHWHFLFLFHPRDEVDVLRSVLELKDLEIKMMKEQLDKTRCELEERVDHLVKIIDDLKLTQYIRYFVDFEYNFFITGKIWPMSWNSLTEPFRNCSPCKRRSRRGWVKTRLFGTFPSRRLSLRSTEYQSWINEGNYFISLNRFSYHITYLLVGY